MDEAAKEVWEMVSYSRKLHGHTPLRLGEVTLTELNFYRLRKFWTKQVFLRTQEPIESKTGADWEWIIGHDDKWIAIRVQAKILGTGADVGRFPHLNHVVGNSGLRQIDILTNPVAGTTPCRWIPLYVFYAASPPLTDFPEPSQGPGRYGCTAAHARAVRHILNRNSTRTNRGSFKPNTAAGLYLGVANPWSTIFDPLISRLANGETLSSIIDGLHDQVLPRRSLEVQDFWDPKKSIGTSANSIPEYMATILDPAYDAFSQADLARLVVKVPQSEPGEKNLETLSETAFSPRLESRTIAKGDADSTGEFWDPTEGSEISRDIEATLAQAEYSAARIGVHSAVSEGLPTRELILRGDSSDERIQSLPSVVSIVNIDQLASHP